MLDQLHKEPGMGNTEKAALKGSAIMARDYYILLGVSKDANLEKIKRAYRRIAKKYHPDTGGSAEDQEKFLEIKEAYETLTDEAARRKYDQERERQGSDPRISRVSDTIRRRASFFDGIDALFSPVDDFFSGFLPGFFERREQRGKDLYVEAILSPAEAARGGLIPMRVPIIEPCPRCGTAGMWNGFFCPVCHGYGRVRAEKHFSLSVPPHVRHGTEIRVSMEDIGLKGAHLNVTILIDSTQEEW